MESELMDVEEKLVFPELTATRKRKKTSEETVCTTAPKKGKPETRRHPTD